MIKVLLVDDQDILVEGSSLYSARKRIYIYAGLPIMAGRRTKNAN